MPTAAAKDSAATADNSRSPMKRSLEHPSHPERICWGCDRYCAANDLACGNGSIRTQHPVELFGEDWLADER